MNVWSSFVGLWVVWCALLGAAGWILSALHQLNRTGYAVFLPLAILAVVWWWRRSVPRPSRPAWHVWRVVWSRWRRRRRRVLPMAFLLLAFLVLLSGLLHAPGNYDGLAYRVPRMLHWLSEGRWHWIDSVDWRVNNRACGFEWVVAPWVLFTGTDRAIFLPNVISFLLLPGLVFSVFTRLGVRPRVAWWWMWLLPSGYCYLMQAGGGANDLFSVPFALAAIDFALRAKVSGRPRDAWQSVLSAALMTSAKATNLPLLLPCALALLPCWRLLWARRLASLAVVIWAALASFAPTAVENQIHCGDWTGAVLDKTAPSPGALDGVLGNTFLLLEQNLAPTIVPFAPWWNRHAPEIMPGWLRTAFERSFERNAWTLLELPTEDTAPLGFGLAVLLIVSGLWVLRGRFATGAAAGPFAGGNSSWVRRALMLAPWVSLLAFMGKVTIATTSRVLAPYFPLLLPALLISPRLTELVSRRWWRWLSLGALFLALLALVINPARPLWPARTLVAGLLVARPGHPFLERVRTVYDVYANRHELFGPVRDHLPARAREIGLVTAGDNPETSLWRPFGSRRLHQLRPDHSPASLRGRGIEYVIVTPEGLKDSFKLSLENWLQQYDAELVARLTVRPRAAHPSRDLFVVRLRAGPGPRPTPGTQI